ncbi:phage tail protein [Urechidicola croceus]|uniref:Glycerol acyltransferase n=1 Tax=Urechidicola croceus TaxID=1850246 RepID=A0A1D8P844_9FLAO|nr:phage tail protein [Urechidicola croceus]AOW20711.1 hypothetical protein LPB138_08490 [Urechidicola croceus]
MSLKNLLIPNYTPPTAFYFSVKFKGFFKEESSFQEVSGLKVTIDTQPKQEGGENQYFLHVPNRPKYSDLILKRSLVHNSELTKWCRDALEDFKFTPRDIHISLLAPGKLSIPNAIKQKAPSSVVNAMLARNAQTLASWHIVQAYPISWELSTLNSTSNQLAIETLTLKYRHFVKEQL